jgi:hypothetical protein
MISLIATLIINDCLNLLADVFHAVSHFFIVMPSVVKVNVVTPLNKDLKMQISRFPGLSKA